MSYVGQVPIFQTGRRKATSRWCSPCSSWHSTPLGLTPQDECRLSDHGETAQPAAFIPRTRLGDVHRARVQVPIRPDGTAGTPVIKGAR